MDPYRTIWFSPKRTFDNFFKEETKQPVYFLPFLIMGVSFAINISSETGSIIGDGSQIWTSAIMIPIGIGIIYLLFALILPSLTKLFGTIWNDRASMRQIVNVYAISLIPYSIILIYQVILFISGKEPLLDNINGSIDYILRLWTFSLLVVGIARIQGFSYGVALLNVLLTYLPFIIVGLILRS